MTSYPKIAALATLSVLLAPPAESRPPPSLIDTTRPVATLIMNDGQNAGAILNTNASVTTLGCGGIIHFNEMASWNTLFSKTDFFDPAVQDLTYFFDDAPSTQSFTLTASDASGIKRLEISLEERGVTMNYYGMVVYDDGPSEFFNVSPSGAVGYLQPVWLPNGSGIQAFSHYEKRLKLEPRKTRLPSDAVLHFDMTTFGVRARLEVTAEDFAGNISSGFVYVAPGSTCI